MGEFVRATRIENKNLAMFGWLNNSLRKSRHKLYFYQANLWTSIIDRLKDNSIFQEENLSAESPTSHVYCIVL